MYSFLLAIYILAALGVIGLVLVQQGEGSVIGASFGAGASNSIFGSTGSGSFLTRMTTIFVAVFFIASLLLARISTNKPSSQWLDPTLGSSSALEQVIESSNALAESEEKVVDVTTEIPAPLANEIPQ